MDQKVLSTNKTLNPIITCAIMHPRLLGFVCLTLHNTNLRTHHTRAFDLPSSRPLIRPTLKYDFNDLSLMFLGLIFLFPSFRPDRSFALKYFILFLKKKIHFFLLLCARSFIILSSKI